MRDLTKHPSTEDLAAAAFEASERVKMLMMMNTPTDYEERKKAAIELAVAQEASMHADKKLRERIHGD